MTHQHHTYTPRLTFDYLEGLLTWEDTRRDFDRFVRHVKSEWFGLETAFTVFREPDGYHYALTDRTNAKGYGFTNPVARFERADVEGEWRMVAVKVVAERSEN